ncbi:MAG: hypothetical protein ABJE95_35500 [Byssovorax sp.]
MNICFLVEGEQTERHVYRSWIEHTFPTLSQVFAAGDMTVDTYYIVVGGGVPRYKKLIRGLMLEFQSYPAIDHFFVCVDAEAKTYAEAVEEIEIEIKMYPCAPQLNIHIIVQHGCIETWFLGHTAMMQQVARTSRMSKYVKFYDVSEQDPESMEACPGSGTRAQFHEEYLQEMFLAQTPRQRYKKSKPGLVLERSYLDALRARCRVTGHLRSLQKLFTTWDAMASVSSSDQ